jgi:phospholipase/lecithinase/hemolysin
MRLAKTVFSVAQPNVISEYTQALNARIVANVSSIVPPGVTLTFFDTFASTQKLLQNPGDYGLVNTTSPCLANCEVFIDGAGGETPIICSNPKEYLFWDGEHPTAKVHAVYAGEVERYIGWGQYCSS